MARVRIIGTVEAAIEIEESLLDRKLPQSFRAWLLENNTLGIGDVHIYPVRDERDTRKTWNSLSYNLKNEWAESLIGFDKERFCHLLPFADLVTGEYFCFDYSVREEAGEWPVVRWTPETGKTEFYAIDFTDFKRKILNG
jgi:hypothetical protein